MIFPVLEVERIVQIGDKTRLSGVKSFSASDTIERVRIMPEATGQFFEVTKFSQRDWYLDWIYLNSSRTVTVTLEIKAGASIQTASQTIQLISALEDKLFSNDQDLEALEPKLLSYVPDGRSSFLNVHREARDKILETFADRGIKSSTGEPLTPGYLLNVEQVRTWSKYLTLALIFQGMSLSPDDIFATKAKIYGAEALSRSEKALVSLDLDQDGQPDDTGSTVYQTVQTGWLMR